MFIFGVTIMTLGETLLLNTADIDRSSITDCFSIVYVQNSKGASTLLAEGLPASVVMARISQYPYVKGVSGGKAKILCAGSTFFCCAQIQVTQDSCAPWITIDGHSGKFKIMHLHFKY